MEFKTCTNCEKVKVIEDFYFSYANDRYLAQCKICINRYGKKQRARERIELNKKCRFTEETRKNMSIAQLGKKVSKETREKLRIAHLGKKMSPRTLEHRKNLSKSIKGKSLNLSEAQHKSRSEKRIGEKNPNWRGGISFLPHTPDFTEQLKELIRNRDGFKCQLCGCSEVENNQKLDVHHIDYSKSNCNPLNLVSLCHRCNSIVNFGRDRWERLFNRKVNKIMTSNKIQLSFRFSKDRSKSWL